MFGRVFSVLGEPPYAVTMLFDGRVWFDFENPEVWHFYRFVLQLATEGHDVHLEWVPLYTGSQRRAMETYLGLDEPQARGRFLHTLLGKVHLEGEDPEDGDLIARVVREVGEAEPPPKRGAQRLASAVADAEELLVGSTPSLYRHGPVLHMVLNPAATMGDVARTARTILDAAANDGIWRLAKP